MNKLAKSINSKIINKPNRIVLLLVIVTLGIHLTYIDNGFTWLDHGDIERKRAVFPIHELYKSFFTNFGDTGFYRPMVNLFHSIDYYLYNLQPEGYHLTNLIIHLGAVVASFYFVKSYFKFKDYESFLASLVVSVHPMSWLVVGAISYRQESLLLLFSLLTVYFHIESREKNIARLKILTLTSFMLALLSKETALVVVPLLIILWEFKERINLRKNYRLFLSEIAIILIYGFLRMKAVPFIWKSTQQSISVNEYLGTRFSVLGKLFYDLLVPFKPDLSDATLVVKIGDLWSITALFFVAVGIYTIIKKGIKQDISQAILISAILLLHSLNIVPIPRVGSPHYGYLATVALGTLIVIILRSTKSKKQLFLKTLYFVVFLWITTMSLSTLAAGSRFENDYTLFQPEVKKDVNFLEGHYYLGNYYLYNQDFENAQKHFSQASSQNSDVIAFVDKPSLYVNWSAVKIYNKDYIEAERLLKKAISNSDKDLQYTYNLGLVYWEKGDVDKTIETIGIHEDNWKFPEALLLLSKAYIKKGFYKDAKRVLQKSLPLLSVAQQEEILTLIDEIDRSSK